MEILGSRVLVYIIFIAIDELLAKNAALSLHFINMSIVM